MSASFFSGATNVQIYGGEFNQVKGNMTVFDHSRHTSHINAYNTSNTMMENVSNNNSQKYHGSNPPNLPGRRSRNDRRRSESESLRHAAEYFPPPTIHPVLAAHLNMPGATSDSRDSFNTTNTSARDVGNDNSEVYGRPRRRLGRKLNSGSRRDDGPDGEEEFEYEEGSSSHSGSSSPRQERRRSRRPSPYQEQFSGQGMPPSHSMSQLHNPIPTLPFFNGNLPGTQMTADYRPGDVMNMPPQMKAPFTQLMQMVQQTTSSSALQGQGHLPPDNDPAEDQIYIEEEAVDDDSAGYDSGEESEDDEEQEERDKRMQEPTSTIASGLANLTLNEQLRPALSQVKSSPSLPLSVPESTPSGQSFYAGEPRHAESTQDLPAHIRYPFIASNNAAQPPVSAQPHAAYNPQLYPYQSFPPPAGPLASNASYGYGENHGRTPGPPRGTAAVSSYPPNPSAAFPGDNGMLAAFGIQPDFIQNNPVGGGPVFNNIAGDYNKTDNTIKTHFIGSGNTTNTLVQDSFNNNSVRASNYKSSEKRRLRK